jgi:hypothetical protein
MNLLITLIIAATLAPVVAIDRAIGPMSQDEGRDAVALGRTRDAAMYDAFHAGYQLAPSGDVERVEVITEFRRAVMIVRQHAEFGEYTFNEANLARALAPYRGLVTFTAQLRVHPLNNFAVPPAFEMYVRSGPATPPLRSTNFKRESVYPPGISGKHKSRAMTAFTLELTVPRADIAAAADPALVIVNDAGNPVWQAKLDLSRFR